MIKRWLWLGGAILTVVAPGFLFTPSALSANYSAKWADQLEGMSLKQGESVAVWVDIKNTGVVTWENTGDNAVKIATIRPRDRKSKLYHSSWLSTNRIAAPAVPVAPGEVGRFAFTITAGAPAGKYREYFSLVAEGITWFDPFYFYVEINIQPTIYQASWVGQSESPTLAPGEEATVWVELRNDGNSAWATTGDNAVKLGTARPLDRVSDFYASSWLSSNRAAVADKIVNPGEIGRFTFTVKAPDKIAKYREYFRPVAEGITWMKDEGIYWEITVNEELVLKNPIQVGLSSTTDNIVLNSDNGMVIRRGSDKGLVARLNANVPVTVTARSGGYVVAVAGSTYDVSDWIKFIPLRQSILTITNEKVSSQYSKFRGIITIRRSSLSNNVWMVNDLELEDYLRGLAEVPDTWPVEARKAQLIAGRTFAVYRMRNPRADIFHLYDDTRDQVYYGYTYELNRPGIGAMAEATKGLVITYAGEPIRAYYFSDSGGATENVENAWNGGNPQLGIAYLKGVNDPYAKPILWEATLDQRYLMDSFAGPLTKINAGGETIVDLLIDDRYPSGRLKTLTLVTSTGKRATVNTATFEASIDTGYVKSTNFTVAKSGAENTPSFILTGKGWGHGVGLPQWSTYNMANLGQSYEQILKYFYTGVNVTTI